MCGRGALRSPFLPQRPLPPSCHPPSCPGTGKTTPERRAPRPRCPSGSRSARQTPRCLHTCSLGPPHGGGRPPGWGQRHPWPRCTSEKATGRPLSSSYCGAGASGTRGRFGPRLCAGLRSPRGRARQSAPHCSAPVQGRGVEGKGTTGVRPATGQPGSYGRRAGYVFGG